MTHVLIVNQHGENRGDEAAMRAMLASFADQIPEVTFTLLYQFRDRNLQLKFTQDVEALPIVLPSVDYLRGVAYSFCKAVSWDARWILPKSIKAIVEAYDKADLVVSAPGGPYFGDIYADHEIIHWWYIWLGRLFKKPVFLYATSAGPFEIKWLNVIRRNLYRKFDVLVSREELSARYIEELLGHSVSVEVTADSAIQASFEPYPRLEFFAGRNEDMSSKFLVAVSLNDYRYPDEKDPRQKKSFYNETMLSVLEYLAEQRDTHFLFLPQLYGAVHSDVPYLRSMADRLSEDISWEIVDPSFDSDMQRGLFAMCDLHIASRYHPAIFGNTAFVPGICIYYEHKALGFMQQLGMERYAFDINRVDAEELCGALGDILARREELVSQLREMVPDLQRRASRTTQLAVELLARRDS